MGTLIYSPGVRVVIEASGSKNGIIDVSEDLTEGSLTIREDAPSTFSFTLINPRRKYDGVFTPNDVISVQMKRWKWMPVFSGYLDEVPYFSVYPRNVTITATDTLKRLKYRLWDPGAEESVSLLTWASGTNSRGKTDGGIKRTITKVMTDVAKWPKDTIHIGALPPAWYKKTEPIREKVMAQIDEPYYTSMGTGKKTEGQEASRLPSPRGGTDLVTNQGERVSSKRMTLLDPKSTAESATGILPGNSLEARSYGKRHGGTGKMILTGEDASDPLDPWYASLRLPYTDDGTTPVEGLARGDAARAKNWWRNRTLLVTNPSNLRSVVLRVADWHANDSTIRTSNHVINTVLRAEEGTVLDVRFAPDSFVPGQTFGTKSEGYLSDAVVPAMGRAATTGETAERTVAARTIPGSDGGGGPDRDLKGLDWTPRDSLKGNVAAARQFVYANWAAVNEIGGYVNRTTASGGFSYHSVGQALDVMVSRGAATGDARVLGNLIANWFATNPQVFGAIEVIWYDQIITAARASEGWRAYSGGSGATLRHQDHVHISFADNGRSSPGPMGGGWGSLAIGAGAGAAAGAGAGTAEGDDSLLNFDWYPQVSVTSQLLTGYRALMNDTPLLQSVATLVRSSMRSFMAAPNGDFVSWFPDYFGTYGTSGIMDVKDIELYGDGFSIVWNDASLITHQYAVGSYTGVSMSPTDPGAAMVDVYNQVVTNGIASVEFPELMEALFNVSKDDPRAKSFLDPNAILRRFGARVDVRTAGILTTPEAEFWYACRLFQRNWAGQFSAAVNLTFMPEIWPGMLLRISTFGFQAYVESVTHSFSFADGGPGFTTRVSVVAPSATDGSGLYGLPKAGKSGTGGVPVPPAGPQ